MEISKLTDYKALNEVEKRHLLENVDTLSLNVISDNVHVPIFEDKPMSSRIWVSPTTKETELEVSALSTKPIRENISIEVSRPRKLLKQSYKFNDRSADIIGVSEFRAYRDLAFRTVKEKDFAIQVAPLCINSCAQTTWHRSVNKSIQYQSSSIIEKTDSNLELMAFLELSTFKVEKALQQNETIDIYLETFRLAGDDEIIETSQAENDLKEIKNFADPTYSKSKALICIDWMPKSNGILAVSAVKNISFDRKILTSGQNSVSHILIWDFRQLVKPIVLLQTNQEIHTFKFNRTLPNIIVGGCVTGQVVYWDITDSMTSALRKSNRNSSAIEAEDEDIGNLPLLPKYISSIEHSHKKSVADLFWLSSNTQINHRGQLIGHEHLDTNSYQFISVAGDGFVLVWDIRFENIFADELRHIAKSKHIPYEKSTMKDGINKPLWAPIFRAQLKRLEGVGELSLCKVCGTSSLKPDIAEGSLLPGDHRSHLLLTSEEGDILFAEVGPRKGEGYNKDDDDDEVDSGRENIRWIQVDQARPTVALQLSPFFPDILLSVGDWNFHIWKIGDDTPLFRSPISSTYLTAASWSPTRPAVILIATGDGQLLAWDFTDSSFRPSLEMKATHSKITSMEYFTAASTSIRQQLIAVGDETGTLHVFELPRNLVRPIHKEETVMSIFLEKENQRNKFVKESFNNDRDSDRNTVDAVLSNNYLLLDDLKGNQDFSDMSQINTPNLSEKIKRQDDDFALLESKFLTELSLNKEDLLSISSKTPLPLPPPKH